MLSRIGQPWQACLNRFRIRGKQCVAQSRDLLSCEVRIRTHRRGSSRPLPWRPPDNYHWQPTARSVRGAPGAPANPPQATANYALIPRDERHRWIRRYPKAGSWTSPNSSGPFPAFGKRRSTALAMRDWDRLPSFHSGLSAPNRSIDDSEAVFNPKHLR